MPTEKSGETGKRRGLGRGLGALIVNTESGVPAESDAERADANDGVHSIAIDAIAPNPHQPRTNFDAAALEELAASIREHGIIQPLIVTRAHTNAPRATEPAATSPATEPTSYWIVAGERRWRAARSAGLRIVPAIVREASTRELMEWALVENVQRADLNPLEEASAYQALMDELHLTQAEVARRVGKSRSAIANTVRLQQLPTAAQDALLTNRISAGHARALLALPDQAAMERTLDLILQQDLSVRQTETLVKELLAAPDAESAPTEPDPPPMTEQMQTHLKEMEDRFRSALSTRVTLNRNEDGSGRLVVHFYNDDDLDTLYRQITGDTEP